MDFINLFKKRDFSATNSWQFLEDVVSDTNLEEWILNGLSGPLRERIIDEIHETEQSKQDQQLKHLIVILDKIIPEMPDDFDRKNDVYEEDIQQLICKTFGLILYIYVYSLQICKDDWSLTDSIFLRAIHFASEKTLTKEILNDVFLNAIERQFLPTCNKQTHLIIKVLIILSNRLPIDSLRKLFKPQICVTIKAFATREQYKFLNQYIPVRVVKCDLIDKLRVLYYKYNIGEIISTVSPLWNPLLEACKEFDSSNIEKATKCLCYVIDHEYPLHPIVLIESKVLSSLFDTLFKSFRNENAVNDIRIFLSILLKYEPGVTNLYTIDKTFFRKLVDHLIQTFDYLIRTREVDITENGLKTNLYHNEHVTSKIFSKETCQVLTILECLYHLNNTWSHWFDIVGVCPMIEKDAFLSPYANKKFVDNTTDLKNFMHYFFINHHFFSYFLTLDNQRTWVESFKNDITSPNLYTISRTNVLNDFEKCSKVMKNTNCDLLFTFEGEIGMGYGCTQEVFTLVSKELQRHDLNMWVGEPVLASANQSEDAVLYTYSANGLFPSALNKSEHFETLIFLLGHAARSQYSLDITLSDAFFHYLSDCKYLYLRRNYYDIPLIFPSLSHLVPQLIQIKKKKNDILSDPSIPDDKKEDMIRKLVFEDGSTFDDLCLNFTIPGTDIELIKGGYDILLSSLNVDQYLEELGKLLPDKQFKDYQFIFYPAFLLCGRVSSELIKHYLDSGIEKWDVEYLKSCCNFANGYSRDSEPVNFLFQVMSSFSRDEQMKFLQFATSSNVLPLKSLRALQPPLTISKYTSDCGEKSLPMAQTCFNMVRLPEYKSQEITREKLLLAITEGLGSFQLA